MPTSLAEVKTGHALKLIAFKCGLTQGSRKADTLSALRRAATDHKPLPSNARVLSIDMGIKNFAFALLSPPDWRNANGDAKITLHAWQNMPLELGFSKALLSPEGSKEEAGVEAEALSKADEVAMSPAQFSPATMAQTASELVDRYLLPLKPTHVLIERQRSRSGGASAVVEWTLRINMLEAMLYALFTNLKARGQWNGELTPVLPNQVFSFATKEFLKESVTDPELMLRGETEHPRHYSVMLALAEAARGKRGSGSPKETKTQKIDMMGVVLDREDKLKLGGVGLEEQRHAFLGRWKSTKATGSRKRAGVDKQLKLDDLADSLLQGLTWMKWQANRDLLASDDVSALLEPYPIDKGEEA